MPSSNARRKDYSDLSTPIIKSSPLSNLLLWESSQRAGFFLMNEAVELRSRRRRVSLDEAEAEGWEKDMFLEGSLMVESMGEATTIIMGVIIVENQKSGMIQGSRRLDAMIRVGSKTNLTDFINKLLVNLTSMASLEPRKASPNLRTAEKLNSSFSKIRSTNVKLPNDRLESLDEQKTYHKRSLHYCKNEADFILKQSQRRFEASFQKGDPWTDNLQNLDRVGNSIVRVRKDEDLDRMENEHRIEIEKLLIEISRLHEFIYDLERAKKSEQQRVKEETEHMYLLQISNLKKSHAAQVEILEATVRKTRDSLSEKTDHLEEMCKSAEKERKMFEKQIESLRAELKEVLDKKNDELDAMREEDGEKLKTLQKQMEEEIEEMKENCEREVKRAKRDLEERERRLGRLQTDCQQMQEGRLSIESTLMREKEEIEQKLQSYIQLNYRKYEDLTNQVNSMLENSAKSSSEREQIQRGLFELEIGNLLRVIRAKDQESQKMKAYYETQFLTEKMLKQEQDNELKALKAILQKLSLQNLQESELLKVKMAALHENDITELVRLYETKIEGLTSEIGRLEEDAARHRKFMHEETYHWYEHKKNYETKISQLNSKLLRLSSGMGSMEKEMKDRFENERSAMLLTSQNLIKEVELKNTNSAFSEDELRKLRMIIERQEEEIDQISSCYRTQLSTLQEENQSLQAQVRHLTKQQGELENEYLTILEQKCEEIKKLNLVTHQMMEDNEQDDSEEVRQLRARVGELENKLNASYDAAKELSVKIDKLEKELHDLKTENEHLYMENQINFEQAKGSYDQASQENLSALKDFYERRLKELELDKAMLQARLSKESENLGELIRKYQVLERGMGRMAKQCERRTRLEEKIVCLGMDSNLVKNKAQLFGQEQ